MKVTCIKDFKYGFNTYFSKGRDYEMGVNTKKVYTVSTPGTHKTYYQLQTNDKNISYKFPLTEFSRYFRFCSVLPEIKSRVEIPEIKDIKLELSEIKIPEKILVNEIPLIETTLINKKTKMAIQNKKDKIFNVKDTFLALTSHTYPYGNEHRLRCFLPEGITRDRHGNYIYQIGTSRTIFACHLDTACKDFKPVVHVIDGDIIKTNGKTILGADDKAGVTVLLYLIYKKIPGTYYFFVGEECGCIGSKAASKDGNFENYDRIISFDRRNTCSIITYQQGSRCCSEDFAGALSAEFKKNGLDLKADDGGLVTDSAQFTDLISECTNISVGYYSEHTHGERQDIGYLTRLCEASALIDWEALPAVRNYKITERKQYASTNVNNHVGGRNRYDQWNDHGRKGYKNHNYDSHAYNTSGSYPQRHDTLFDVAFEEDRKKKNKKKTKNKEKYMSDRFDRFDKFENVNDEIIESLIRAEDRSRDIFLPFKELLNQQSFIVEPGTDMPLFSLEEYTILEDNLIKDY